MARFKITATATMTVAREIEAPTKEDAESIFYDDSYQDMIEDADGAYITGVSIDHVEKTTIDYKVHITEIEYDLDEEDGNPDLPKDLTLWVESDVDKDDSDFDNVVYDAVEEEVGFPVENFKYTVLSSR